MSANPEHSDSLSEADFDGLLKRLSSRIPAHCILTREEDTRPFECDGLSLYRSLPPIVVLPENEAQIIEVIRACKAFNVPVVPRGGRHRFVRWGNASSAKAYCWECQAQPYFVHRPGIRHGGSRTGSKKPGNFPGRRALRAVLRARSFQPDRLFHRRQRRRERRRCALPEVRPDRAQHIACTHNHGRRRSGGAWLRRPTSAGLDLLAAFIGSEGMLGIVTQATIKLIPTPTCARVIMASFPTVESAGEAVANVIATGIIPAGLEMMDKQATHMVEPFVKAGYDLDAAAILLCESDGTIEEGGRRNQAHERGIFHRQAQPACRSPLLKRNVCGFGRGARMLSLPQVAYRPITTAWMARFHAAT